MDATTIERLKHAQEVLGWKTDGKEFVWVDSDGREYATVIDACDLVYRIMHGAKYRLKPAKTIRPFTGFEARRLAGCVIVGENDTWVASNMWPNRTLEMAMERRWHYHLPGDPDNLKPCWVEE